METVLGWHFVGSTLRDGRPVPPDGEWIDYIGRWDEEKQRHIPTKIVPCASGLHASERIVDALKFAPGSTICRVELRGDLKREDDRIAGREWRILWRVDGHDLLREFARLCALDVIHLWDAPEIVRRYLQTGDEYIRQSAMKAAWDAARAAADAAVWAAVWAADNAESAENAARAAAWDAARAAADATAKAAVWAADNAESAEIVARAAAWDAARAAADATAWDAARAAADATAKAAARKAQNARLTEMVKAARKKGAAR